MNAKKIRTIVLTVIFVCMLAVAIPTAARALVELDRALPKWPALSPLQLEMKYSESYAIVTNDASAHASAVEFYNRRGRTIQVLPLQSVSLYEAVNSLPPNTDSISVTCYQPGVETKTFGLIFRSWERRETIDTNCGRNFTGQYIVYYTRH